MWSKNVFLLDYFQVLLYLNLRYKDIFDLKKVQFKEENPLIDSIDKLFS